MLKADGAGGRNRTCNLLITNQLLCQLSYTGGGALGWNRTADIWIFSPPLYHLSYQGIFAFFQGISLIPRNEAFRMATRNGLEPSTSSVTGWRSNQLSYRAIFSCICSVRGEGDWWAFRDSNPGPIGYEPTALTTALKAHENATALQCLIIIL